MRKPKKKVTIMEETDVEDATIRDKRRMLLEQQKQKKFEKQKAMGITSAQNKGASKVMREREREKR